MTDMRNYLNGALERFSLTPWHGWASFAMRERECLKGFEKRCHSSSKKIMKRSEELWQLIKFSCYRSIRRQSCSLSLPGGKVESIAHSPLFLSRPGEFKFQLRSCCSHIITMNSRTSGFNGLRQTHSSLELRCVLLACLLLAHNSIVSCVEVNIFI